MSPMNRFKKTAITVIACGTVSFSAFLLAHPADHKDGWRGDKPAHHSEMRDAHFSPEHQLKYLDRQLELTDAQKDTIQGIIEKSREKSKPLQEKL